MAVPPWHSGLGCTGKMSRSRKPASKQHSSNVSSNLASHGDGRPVEEINLFFPKLFLLLLFVSVLSQPQKASQDRS